MSRVFVSALVVSVLGAGYAHAGSLNINPFPMGKAGTLSTQGPAVQDDRSFQDFADGIDEITIELNQIEQKQQKARTRNQVDMTPMPEEYSATNAQGVYKAKVTSIEPSRHQSLNLDNARIEILPFDGSDNPLSPAFLTATEGESVEDVLRSWSNTEGIGLLWKTRLRFGVIETISVEGGFEKSVETLLSQYAGTARPLVGHLDTDPVTGVRTLSVMTR